MTWEDVFRLRPNQVRPPRVSVGIASERRTDDVQRTPRISFNINKSLFHQLGIAAGSRADLEVGSDTHLGLVRIRFDRATGSCRVVADGQDPCYGCRVSVAIWPGLRGAVPRVRLTADQWHWQATSKTLTIALPPAFFEDLLYPQELKLLVNP